VGSLIGACKWFSDSRGYGFITVCSEAGRGTDVFVHFTGLRPLNNHHRKLYKGEYVSFDVLDAEDRKQAVNITGVLGGPLMCDHEYPAAAQPAAFFAPPPARAPARARRGPAPPAPAPAPTPA
jgi:cold shock CspA family protein